MNIILPWLGPLTHYSSPDKKLTIHLFELLLLLILMKAGIFLSLVGLMLSGTAPVLGRPAGVSSLAEMPCQKVEGIGRYHARSERISIGREMFKGVAFLGASGSLLNISPGIHIDKPTAVVCELTPNGVSPLYKTLKLRSGMNQGSSLVSGREVIQLTVYLDGQAVRSQRIRPGQVYSMPIDVSQASSVALEGTCLRTASRSKDYCPRLWFVSDVLYE